MTTKSKRHSRKSRSRRSLHGVVGHLERSRNRYRDAYHQVLARIPSERLLKAAHEVNEIVEGVRSDRWAANGQRLKDTKEWVEFYLALREPNVESAERLQKAIQEVQCLIEELPAGEFSEADMENLHGSADRIHQRIMRWLGARMPNDQAQAQPPTATPERK